MPYFRLFTVLCICVLALGADMYAQSISGTVTDEQNNPLPFANVFVRELNTGTSTDQYGRYFMTLDAGIYHVVFSSVGFESQAFEWVVGDQPLERNVRLATSRTQLHEVVVKARRRDPAFEIMEKVIAQKEKYITQAQSARTQVYVRAMEQVDPKKKKAEPPAEELEQKGPPVDPFEAARKKEEARLQQINLLEMQLTLNYQYPDQYKEERTAYKLYGRSEGLYIPVFSEADFNFYYNRVDMKGISEIPLISPLSRAAVLSYKYKLEDVLKEKSGVVYKIRVTPRKTGDATVKGLLYVNDSTWNINRLELTLEKGGLRFYDAFTIRQNYEEIEKDFWIPIEQEFVYETKASGKLFKGITVLRFSEYQKDYTFPPRFFGNEVAVTTREAYKRDSSFWNATRLVPLTEDQRKVVAYSDSVEAVMKSKKYLDSIEAKFNKVTIGEVLYHGIGFRNEERKSYINMASLLNFIDFSIVGGFRLGPYFWYFRRFENDELFSVGGALKYGIKNHDLTGNVNTWWRYNPYRQGDLGGQAGRTFYSINSFDAYLNQLKLSNYILHEHVDGFHRIELFNGFYWRTEVGFHNRQSLKDYDATSIIDEVYDQGEVLVFDDYFAFFTTNRLSYTPAQRFMTEPTRKVILGSKYPTLHVTHKKGWNGVLGSEIDFDYLETSVEQNILLGTLGNSRYSITTGKFVNTRDLRYVDLKRFRQSDPYLYSDPLHSFQLLDTALSTTNWFFEAHYIHHFNGAMINNIPLIKKTKIRTVAGAGMMWVKETGFRYEEIFGGIERIFKLGPRRRLRVGAYGVLAQQFLQKPKTDFKVSFDIIDTWKRDWSY